MLELKKIKKVYETKDLKVTALDNVSIKFRKNEFVSILGPSGCGKTTMLNIIGGLDKYTSGDLIINDKSTKDFKDRDWDVYRNHTVGFVFQSYNLIPHQTVLENVEIALTLSGISKAERKKRAVEALKKVGLKDKIKSKPNQLSGGQMQRVAIARALVNDPDIVLADEPTGALDSKTSVQVMELLKEISEEKLVVMVTHNPELAKEYSTRIITFLDGKLQEDSNPIIEDEVKEDIESEQVVMAEAVQVAETKPKKRKKKHSEKTTMSFFTALSLSMKNLLTKKARTALVSFAGSIGIIGIALILALSTGFQTYVNRVQEDTLSTNPITIEAQSIDYTDIIASMMLDRGNKNENDGDAIYSNDSLSQMINSMGSGLKANNLSKFYSYLKENYSEIEDYVSSIQYTYDVGLEFYDKNNANLQPSSTALYDVVMQYSLLYLQKETGLEVEEKVGGGYVVSKPANGEWNRTFLESYKDSSVLMQELLNKLDADGVAELNDTQIASIIYVLMNIPIQGFQTYNMRIFSEMIDNVDLLKEQYDLVGTSSKWADPTSSDEVMLVLDSNNSLDDYILYALGFVTKDEMKESLNNVLHDQDPTMKINYNNVIGKEFKVLSDIDYYVNIGTESEPNYVDIREEYVNTIDYGNGQTVSNPTDEYYTYYNQIISSDNVKTIKITGIIRLKESATSGCLSTGIAYTSGLTNYMVEKNNNSKAVEGNFASVIEKDNPQSISIYASSFDSKDVIEGFISEYNRKQENEEDKITYTNIIGMVMDGVSTIINAITYVLIAFVSISLVVSSIMIGIITYISVLERIKEIGILRSVGASKRDIKRVFTAETLIIGFVSGVLGILITLLLTIPINIILRAVTGIAISASLPVASAFILIGISMLLTFIAGLIPANIASKKDPVTCLRTE